MRIKNDGILSNVLFIAPENSFFYNVAIGSDVNVSPLYRGENNVILKIFRKIHFRFNFPLKHLWFHKVDMEYKFFFVSEELIPEYVDWLHSFYPYSKFIMLYINKCRKANSPTKFHHDFLKIWSGDVNDCLTYNLNLCPNAISYARSWKVHKTEPQFDVFFVGKDKYGHKRLDDLMNLEKQFNLLGFKTYFHIAPEREYKLYNNKRYKRVLPYSEVLKFLGKTRAILYLGYSSQECITVRVQESLVHKIKLITDCAWLKKYDFFHSDNIFILGEDKMESLPEFLNKPYFEIESSILRKIYFEDFAEQIVFNSWHL